MKKNNRTNPVNFYISPNIIGLRWNVIEVYKTNFWGKKKCIKTEKVLEYQTMDQDGQVGQWSTVWDHWNSPVKVN